MICFDIYKRNARKAEYDHTRYPLDYFWVGVFLILVARWLLALEDIPKVQTQNKHGGKSKAKDYCFDWLNF